MPRALTTACGEVNDAFRGRRAKSGPARVLADRAAITVLRARFTTLFRNDKSLGNLDQSLIPLKELSASMRSGIFDVDAQ
jgi:hypothetical protein